MYTLRYTVFGKEKRKQFPLFMQAVHFMEVELAYKHAHLISLKDTNPKADLTKQAKRIIGELNHERRNRHYDF